MPLLVTGANGNLGRALFETAADGAHFRAAVRSQRAADQVAALPKEARPTSIQVDYSNATQMGAASQGCEAVVHLVGIIKEAASTTYEVAHEASCEVLARAAAESGVQRIVYMSIVGSQPDSENACLSSKGRAEQILLNGPIPATILRVPMVLGRGDFATAALRSQGSAKSTRLVGGGTTLQQPIDARDVVAAIDAASRDLSKENRRLDLGGPECLPHHELIARAAQALGTQAPRISSMPLGLAKLFASIAGSVLSNPPITSAMLGVLQHDDQVDSSEACEQLGLTLTPLDETLAHCLREEGNHG